MIEIFGVTLHIVLAIALNWRRCQFFWLNITAGRSFNLLQSRLRARDSIFRVRSKQVPVQYTYSLSIIRWGIMSDAIRQRAFGPMALMTPGIRSPRRGGSSGKHSTMEAVWEAEFREEVRKKILREIEDRESTIPQEEPEIPVAPPVEQNDQPLEPNILIWIIIGSVIFAIFVSLVKKMMA